MTVGAHSHGAWVVTSTPLLDGSADLISVGSAVGKDDYPRLFPQFNAYTCV